MRSGITICGLAMAAMITTWLLAFTGHPESTTVPLSIPVPSGFPSLRYNVKLNPLTEQGFQLGRRLFYDGQLSKDGNFSCASCHQQFAAFSTYDHDLSHGFDDQFTKRNAPPLFNLAWQTAYHWDGGVNNLEVQALAPLTAPNEMAEDLNHVIAKLKRDSIYPGMFRAAFGTKEITGQRMLKAMAQFTCMMVSANSKYDRVKSGLDTFTTYEARGYELYKIKCSNCHTEPLFTDMSFRNSGLPLNKTLKDYGRMQITNDAKDSLKFRVPTLRNIFQTFPYGHDGRFNSLYQVMEHYNSGIQQSATLDSSLRKRIAVNDADKYYLYQFLKTLTDSSFITNKRFAQPN